MYRGKDGLKCAAGCLISDEEYSPTIEGEEWRFLVSLHKVPMRHCDLIIALQSIHDTIEIEFWKERLLFLAAKCGLSTEVLNENYPSNPTTSNSPASI